MKDLEWFKKEVAPLLVDYEIEYRYYNQGDFSSLNQIVFESLKNGDRQTFEDQVAGKFSAPLDKLTKNIQSPLLKNLITHEISGLPFGTLMGGVVAELDDNPETSFLDGMWNGAKMSLMTSGLSAIGTAAQYSLDNKINVLTGVSDQNQQIQQTAMQLGLRSAQQGVKQEIVDMYYEQMASNAGSAIAGILGAVMGGSSNSSSSARSEERRVGKECRSRWSPYH